MTWIDINKKKPELGQTCLIIEQGYGVAGNYYEQYVVAIFIKNPNDKRHKVFANPLQVKYDTLNNLSVSRSVWIYRPGRCIKSPYLECR